jgi:hypothetical protein
MQSVAHRLRMASQYLGDLANTLTLPAAHHHRRVSDPISWRVHAARESTLMLRFGPIP